MLLSRRHALSDVPRRLQADYRVLRRYQIGGAYITGTMVQPASPSTFSTAALGLDFAILDENGTECDNGELFLIPPSMGLSNQLLNRDHHEVYFAGTPERPYGTRLRRHGDQVERLREATTAPMAVPTTP